MQKQVPVFYDDVEVPNFRATITTTLTEGSYFIDVMEIMRITSFLKQNLQSFVGVQRSQVFEDKVVWHSVV